MVFSGESLKASTPAGTNELGRRGGEVELDTPFGEILFDELIAADDACDIIARRTWLFFLKERVW